VTGASDASTPPPISAPPKRMRFHIAFIECRIPQNYRHILHLRELRDYIEEALPNISLHLPRRQHSWPGSFSPLRSMRLRRDVYLRQFMEMLSVRARSSPASFSFHAEKLTSHVLSPFPPPSIRRLLARRCQNGHRGARLRISWYDTSAPNALISPADRFTILSPSPVMGRFL